LLRDVEFPFAPAQGVAWFRLKGRQPRDMKSGYSVLRFVLKQTPDGRLTQEVRRCGEFADVEQAFDTARMEVLREWQEAVNQPELNNAPGRVVEIKIKDTEWGYELKKDHQVVSRFWVHDTAPAVIPGT
jgi:hypothetical protein